MRETEAQDRLVPVRAADFLGVPVHPLTMSATEELVVSAMRNRQHLHHVALNVAKFVKMRHSDDLRKDVMSADIVGIDGMGILLGARALGVHVPERVTGVDLMENLLARCAEEGFRPFLLGARPEILTRAIDVLQRRLPKLELAGSHHGYFTRDDEAALIREIRDARPDCLFVAMPTPQKERFMARYQAELGVPFVMGVGGGLDVVAGHVQRAPTAWQRSGFEWLFRVVQEPRRMWRRYLTTNAAFAFIMLGALCRRAVGLPLRQLASSVR
ncbi:MAG: WecB/TagA/CpsF family glycosyltransferase [Acidisphaera sp.]|nr:WecB/TagA/CpsF family glycosyltransferase [Acidisphaera sp.]MBV9813790.1 WecB/TagA/CpsF family glycosyltransferase [Acetobacteraceae bacterium]